MDRKQEQRTTALSDFVSELYRKGYRGKYTASIPGSGHQPQTNRLEACLNLYFGSIENMQRDYWPLELETSPPYSPDITCHFKIGYDDVKGFRVKELNIRDRKSHEQLHYPINNNNQIPGAQTLEGLFPRPKPWDRHLKGRFRP